VKLRNCPSNRKTRRGKPIRYEKPTQGKQKKKKAGNRPDADKGEDMRGKHLRGEKGIRKTSGTTAHSLDKDGQILGWSS